jgi:replicative DNA helicase
MPTGFSDLDRLLSGGLHIETLTIVAGRPGTGKTSWGLQVALEVAERTGPSVFFSLEETQRSLAARAVGWRSRISPSKASARMLSEPDLQQMSLAWQALSDTPLYLQDTARTLMEIAAWCQRLGSTRPLCCVVVDYLQLLATHGKMDRHEAVAVVSRGLKRLAREYHVAVLALSQLNRAPDARQDKRPHLSDLRESGALEQDADVVVLLYRGEMYKPTEANRGIAEAILAKHRAGPTGVVRLAWRDHLAQFSDLAE